MSLTSLHRHVVLIVLGTINKSGKKEQGQAPSQNTTNASTEPIASSATNTSIEPLASSAIYASPKAWPRAQSPPRPSPGLERNLRLARALASSAIFALTEPLASSATNASIEP